jgi:hypothetical protein
MTMALLLHSMHRHPCHCQTGIVALVTMALLFLICNGVVALIAMALSLSSSWHHCPYCNGVVVIIDAQVSLLSLQWRCCTCCNGVVAVDAQASLPSLQWQMLPLSQWRLCHS